MENQANYKNPTCKGSYSLGTACGSCERCAAEKAVIDGNMEAIEKKKRVPFSVQFDAELIHEMMEQMPFDDVVEKIASDMFTKEYVVEILNAINGVYEEAKNTGKKEEGTV